MLSTPSWSHIALPSTVRTTTTPIAAMQFPASILTRKGRASGLESGPVLHPEAAGTLHHVRVLLRHSRSVVVVVVALVAAAPAAGGLAVVAVAEEVAAAAAAAAAVVVGAPPPYQPPLLPSLLRARSFYSVFTIRSSCHTTSSCLKIHSATLINSASDLGGVGGVGVVGRGVGGGGVGGDDDDIGTQTPRTISPQGPFYSVFTVLS